MPVVLLATLIVGTLLGGLVFWLVMRSGGDSWLAFMLGELVTLLVVHMGPSLWAR